MTIYDNMLIIVYRPRVESKIYIYNISIILDYVICLKKLITHGIRKKIYYMTDIGGRNWRISFTRDAIKVLRSTWIDAVSSTLFDHLDIFLLFSAARVV